MPVFQSKAINKKNKKNTTILTYTLIRMISYQLANEVRVEICWIIEKSGKFQRKD